MERCLGVGRLNVESRHGLLSLSPDEKDLGVFVVEREKDGRRDVESEGADDLDGRRRVRGKTMEEDLSKGSGGESDRGEVLVVDEGELEASRRVVSGTDEEGGGLTRIESSDLSVLAGESEMGS